jgi:(E)-4-hydroxy-3-methyl-but-2-enyl pyrophosphate reductase
MAFKIKVVESAGFCFGVRKALDRLIEIRNKTGAPVRTLGPLIHNEQVLEALKNRDVHELQEDENVAGTHVIIRAHGVTPDKRRQLLEQKARVCDATCPKVGQVQAIVKKYAQKSCPVIIIGDRGHAEVEGLLGYCGRYGIVITGPEEAARLKEGDEVCVVAQTTQDPLVFQHTLDIIKQKFTSCHEFNTICDATSERQAETRKLAEESDIMVVVGGKNSANTRRLADIAEKNSRTIMIQSADDLDPDTFTGVHRVGITAGASTPAWVIREIVEKIRLLGWEREGWLPSCLYKSLVYFTRLPFSWALGTALLCVAVVYTLTRQIPWLTAGTTGIMIWIWKSRGRRVNAGLDMGISGFLAIVSVSPLYGHVSEWVMVLAFVYLGVTYLNRLLLFDSLHVQADKISGHPTIPAVLCAEKCERFLEVSIGVSALCALILSLMAKEPLFSILLLIPAGFIAFLRKKRKKPGWCDVRDVFLMDTPIWLASLLVIGLQALRT